MAGYFYYYYYYYFISLFINVTCELKPYMSVKKNISFALITRAFVGFFLIFGQSITVLKVPYCSEIYLLFVLYPMKFNSNDECCKAGNEKKT